ncbi:hypothetical protein ACLOJK_006386 [Asimina triloba]
MQSFSIFFFFSRSISEFIDAVLQSLDGQDARLRWADLRHCSSKGALHSSPTKPPVPLSTVHSFLLPPCGTSSFTFSPSRPQPPFQSFPCINASIFPVEKGIKWGCDSACIYCRCPLDIPNVGGWAVAVLAPAPAPSAADMESLQGPPPPPTFSNPCVSYEYNAMGVSFECFPFRLFPLLLLSFEIAICGSAFNANFLGEHLNVGCLEDGNGLDFGYGPLLTTESLRLGESSNSIFHNEMPFLQMLQGAESPPISPLAEEPNLQLLLRLQHQKKPWKTPQCSDSDARIPPLELESCITHVSESHSPVKSETKDQPCPHSSSCLEAASSPCNNGEPISPRNCKDGDVGRGNSGSSTACVRHRAAPQFSKPALAQEKRKRKKRSRPMKNSDEVESQRMTHIAVERNRRKQMNDHLNALRSLMPPSFIQRGDQASIVGGAIDFVKELEQLLQSLQAQKRLRQAEEEGHSSSSNSTSTAFNGFFTSPQYTTYSSSLRHRFERKYPFKEAGEVGGSEFTAENKTAVADVEVTVIQTHVNLKVLSRRRPGQLVKAIAALEELSLAILHLNVTSLESSVLYSFNLKEHGWREGAKLMGWEDGVLYRVTERLVHVIFENDEMGRTRELVR